ncbi:chemotaxis protein cheY [Haloferula helveola]|uniref:Chemotaxis protein cheY n=1 Tax=Haloferula helveola TaxID=490095 RepID=A0ABN6H7R6_9BACT|nr:chemotaxis protein cheY [Haloferula helveola]
MGDLLTQIQNEAVDGESDLSSLLRKCRVLAQRIDNAALKEWVNHELNGYSDAEALPAYRIIGTPCVNGHYFGSFSSEIRNVPIPRTAVDERVRDHVFTLPLLPGVRVLEEQADSATDGYITFRIAPEACGFVHDPSIAPGFHLGAMQKILSVSALEGVLDSVRNRILNFTLELESEADQTGDPLVDLRERKAGTVDRIFHTHIQGDVENFAAGSSGFSQQSVSVPQAGRGELIDALTDLGLDPGEIGKLIDAVESEAPKSDGTFGPRVSGLMGRAFASAGEGLLKVPAAVAGELLTAALKGYYGIAS